MPEEAVEVLDELTQDKDMLGATEIQVSALLLESLVTGVTNSMNASVSTCGCQGNV